MDNDRYSGFWQRFLSAIWWFKLPVLPYALYLFTFFVLIILCSLPFKFLGHHHEIGFLVLDSVLTASSAVLTMWLLFRFFEKRRLQDSGFDVHHAGRDLLVGFGIGILLVVCLVFVLWVLGVYEFVRLAKDFQPVPMLLVYLFAAILEEVIFRGFVFQTAEKRMGTRWAFVLTCILFGLAHMTNDVPNTSTADLVWGCICLIFEAGIVLNAAFLVRRTLWLPIGLHWAWNFFEGPIFGMTVSGTPLPTQFIVAEMLGDKMLTGGNFGPEASVGGLIVGTLAGAAMLRYLQVKGAAPIVDKPAVKTRRWL